MHLQVSIALLFILLTGGFPLDCNEGLCEVEICDEEQSNCRSMTTAEYDDLSLNYNGKRCFTCDFGDCSHVADCQGYEDFYCFSAKENKDDSLTIKGCASRYFCYDEPILSDYSDISCCEGNLCNGAQSVTQSILFLCCSLLSYFLLH